MGGGAFFFKDGWMEVVGGSKTNSPLTKFIVCGNVANILINVADI